MQNKRYKVHFYYDETNNPLNVFNSVAVLMTSIDKINNTIAESFGYQVETVFELCDMQPGAILLRFEDRLHRVSSKSQASSKLRDVLIESKQALWGFLQTAPGEMSVKLSSIMASVFQQADIASLPTIQQYQLLKVLAEFTDTLKTFRSPPEFIFDETKIVIDSSFRYELDNAEDIHKHTYTVTGEFMIKKLFIDSPQHLCVMFDQERDVIVIDPRWQTVLHQVRPLQVGDVITARLVMDVFYDAHEVKILETRYYLDEVEKIEQRQKETAVRSSLEEVYVFNVEHQPAI